MANVVIALTSSGKWQVPADCNSIQIELIASGGGYDTIEDIAGGGGAYTKLTGFSVTPGQTLTYATQNPTWISNTGGVPTNTSQGAKAAGTTGSYGQVGGAAADCIPSVGAFSGGNGGFLNGCGGAAGPNGNGGSGGPSNGVLGGGGGGANGGSNGGYGTGGDGRGGTGGGTAGVNGTTGTGGGGGGQPSAAVSSGGGAQDNVWTDYLNNVYGPGGGAGGIIATSSGSVIGVGVGYGGGYSINQGLIIITYTPVAITGGPYTEVFTLPYYSTTAIPWRTPLGVTSVQVEAIGGGGIPLDAISGRGGGGGAYAKTTSLAVTPENIAYVRPAYTPVFGTQVYATPIDSWFNRNANTAPAPGDTSAGLLAAGAASGLGGTAANCIGVDLKYSGGNGGLNNTTASGGKFRGGGGGGAAGPSGAGKDGGNGWPTGTGSGTGGGGGGSNGGSSTAGQTAPSATVGGAGGNGTGGLGGGAGGTATTNAVAGTANTGGGGGGGSASATGFRTDGKPGAASTVWTIGGVNYGPAGGAGGAGATTSTTGQAGYHDLDINFGAGAGSGNPAGFVGSSTRGLVIITYSAVSAIPAISARLFSTGTLAIANTMQFNEIAQNNASIQSNVVYSSLFDEVSQSAVAMRILSNGSIQVSNIFDEVTGIS